MLVLLVLLVVIRSEKKDREARAIAQQQADIEQSLLAQKEAKAKQEAFVAEAKRRQEAEALELDRIKRLYAAWVKSHGGTNVSFDEWKLLLDNHLIGQPAPVTNIVERVVERAEATNQRRGKSDLEQIGELYLLKKIFWR